ncbi:hypothetical protein [Mucilaginibacter psychrotolerans]|uniref:DUF4369 domain-containing protein n=1 Tax=Mucilaginibacter psychrotolerans TaxID=1524096 RepID=A0A4Y8SC53_9SPHI|nr:hypothetical protein [Mucilaginibacter psychrotolerans]TFF36693.1 hypothetical protein E2R66_14670 [Mucilaginibacter psychrotolerans]
MRRILLLLFISGLWFSASAQMGEWTAGCYYLLDSSKVCGIIKWNEGDNIQFKTTDTAGKVKIKTTDLKAFVIKADSFVISHNPDLRKYPVLMVTINTPLKLYMNLIEVTSASGFGGYSSGYAPRYFYGSNPNDIKKISRKNFIEIMTQILAGNEFFVEAIKDGRYSYDFMGELLLAYDTAKQRGLLNNAK